MKTFKEYIIEQSTQPIMTQYNPVYGFNQQQYKPNRGASPLPQQDPAMAKIQGGMMEVAKILDPTGILSYEDIPPAVNTYNTQPTPMNALFMLLAFTAVIPIAGKVAAPLKVAAKAGDYKKVIQLTPYVANKVAQLVEKNVGNLSKLNIPQETIQKALQMVKTAKAEEMMPLSYYKNIIKDFKQQGGIITRPKRVNEPNKDLLSNWYGHATDKLPPQINISRTDNTPLQTFSHELGHHDATVTPGSFHASLPSRKSSYQSSNSIDNLYYKVDPDTQLKTWGKLAKEREANQAAINKMRGAGASSKQIEKYQNSLKDSLKTYKLVNTRNIDYLAPILASKINIPQELVKDALEALNNKAADAFASMPEQFLDKFLKLDDAQQTIMFSKFNGKYFQQFANTQGGIYKTLYNEYKKILANPNLATNMLKNKGIAFESKKVKTYKEYIIESRQHIDWNSNYGKTFKLARTPKGRQSTEVEWTPDLISVITPENGNAWNVWKEVDRDTLLRWKNNWDTIQKSLGQYKYDQIIRSKNNSIN